MLFRKITRDIVPWPSSAKPIDCKRIYSIKLQSDGLKDWHKARLFALGNRQEHGIDYDEKFAPIARMALFEPS